MNYTAQFTKIDSGYMGQILEFPEVVTEGVTIEDCKYMLKDAFREMCLAYRELGKTLPIRNIHLEQFEMEASYVC